MQESVLTDRFGHCLGYIETSHDGVQIARTRYGRTVGYYDPSSNVTRDRFGREVGRGNLLAVQIHENQE